MKHDRQRVQYEDSEQYRYICTKCGVFMGLDDQGEYPSLSHPECVDGECPGHPLHGDQVFEEFVTFYISPGYGGSIDSSIRRLYGGSGFLSESEEVTREDFESEYGRCLGMRITEDGHLEAVTERYIVSVGEYDGSEWLEAVERTPEWLRGLDDA
jgi:hypothetical protein